MGKLELTPRRPNIFVVCGRIDNSIGVSLNRDVFVNVIGLPSLDRNSRRWPTIRVPFRFTKEVPRRPTSGEIQFASTCSPVSQENRWLPRIISMIRTIPSSCSRHRTERPSLKGSTSKYEKFGVKSQCCLMVRIQSPLDCIFLCSTFRRQAERRYKGNPT